MADKGDRLDTQTIQSTGIPSGEQHPPWQEGATAYGPETPGAYARAIRTFGESVAGGGFWDHERGGGGEVLVPAHLYAPTGERRRLSTVSRRSAQFVERVRPRLDATQLSPSEIRVWQDLEQGHAVEWIASHRGMRRDSVKRIMDKLRAGGLGATSGS